MNGWRTRQRVALASVAAAAALSLTGCGLLQDVFPKAFDTQEELEARPTAKADPSPEEEWRRVNTDAGDLSFLVHEDWLVETIEATGQSSSTDIPAYRVMTEDGRLIATLQQNPGRETPSSIPGSTFTQIDSSPADDVKLPSASGADVVLDLVTHPNAENVASYGLTARQDVPQEIAPGRSVPVGGGREGFPKLAGALRFEGRAPLGNASLKDRRDDAVQAAEDYTFTQEYANITHMLASVRYHPDDANAHACSGTYFDFESVNVDCQTVVSLYDSVRIAEAWDSRSGGTVRAGKWTCQLKELGAELDGQYPGYGEDGRCRITGGYGSFTALWR